MGIEQADRASYLGALQADYERRTLPLQDHYSISAAEIRRIIQAAFSLVASTSEEASREIFQEFFTDLEEPKLLMAHGLVTTLCALQKELLLGQQSLGSPLEEYQQAKDSLLWVGQQIRQQAKQDFEAGVTSLLVIGMPLLNIERSVRAKYARIYTDLERMTDTDERKLWLAIQCRSALVGPVYSPAQGLNRQPNVESVLADIPERRQLMETSEGEILRLVKKIHFFDPENHQLTPQMLNLLVGAIRYGQTMLYDVQDRGIDEVFDVELDQVSADDIQRQLLSGETLSLREVSSKKLRQALRRVDVEDPPSLFQFARTIGTSLSQATSTTGVFLTRLLIEGLPSSSLDEGAEGLSSPLVALLDLASDEGSDYYQKAGKTMRTIIKASAGHLVYSAGPRHLILEGVMLGDFTLRQQETFLEIYFAFLRIKKPSNWEEFIRAARALEGNYILTIWGDRTLLSASDERSRLVQTEEILAALSQGQLPPKLVWEAEYPEPEEEVVEIDGVVVYQAPPEKVIKEAAPVAKKVVEEMDEGTALVVEEEIVKPAPPEEEIEDSPDLPVAERLYRFLRRLGRERVIREMTEEEALDLMVMTEKKWQDISPFVPLAKTSKTRSLSRFGTHFHLKGGAPKKARISVIPHLAVFRGDVLSGKGISDVRANIVVAKGETEDLVLRFAVTKDWRLVPVYTEDEITKIFLEEALAREGIPPFTMEQLGYLVINAAYSFQTTSSRVLEKRARSIVERALTVRPSKKKGEKKRRGKAVMSRKAPVRVEEGGYIVVVYSADQESPYPTEEAFMAALERGEIVIEESELTINDVVATRSRYDRKGLTLREPVRDTEAGFHVWLGFTEEGHPKIPTRRAAERGIKAGVPPRRADVWRMDPQTGELECHTVFGTFRRERAD